MSNNNDPARKREREESKVCRKGCLRALLFVCDIIYNSYLIGKRRKMSKRKMRKESVGH